MKINGKSFFLGDNVDTDQILPGYAMSYSVDELKNVVLSGSELPDFAKRVAAGDVLFARENFGCGSSREQAPLALKSTGLGVIVAKSFARIFRKNSINIGLPVITSQEVEKIIDESKVGDVFDIDIKQGEIINLRTGIHYSAEKPSAATYDTLLAGGLINKVRQILKKRGDLDD